MMKELFPFPLERVWLILLQLLQYMNLLRKKI